MSLFCKRVIEYMFENRLDQFISSFYELYQKYSYMEEETFFREWFHRPIIRDLVYYFPPSVLISSFEEFERSKGRLLRTYVRTYWNFCKNPRRYPVNIEEALKFFGIKELNESTLRESYRKMVKRFHPDRVGRSREAHLNMVKVNYYYQILRRYLGEKDNGAV